MTLDEMIFVPTQADPDVWMRSAVKLDGEAYYEYILVYVDDILVISDDHKIVMEHIQVNFKFKDNKVEPPAMYIGAKLKKNNIENCEYWTMSTYEYIQAAIKNVQDKLSTMNMRLQKHAHTLMSSGYRPELDQSEELDENDTQYVQELIGILRWATEIGRVDILTEVAMLFLHQTCPRQGHMEEILHIFALLRNKSKLSLYFDYSEPQFEMSIFNHDFTPLKEHYRDVYEELPFSTPQPRGRAVTTTAYVDASHAANKVTRRSHTGYILFVNKALILWHSKRQNTVESSTFFSEFIVMRTLMKATRGLRYKLRMFGVPLDGPTKVLCVNEKVVHNSSRLESTLNKKHSSIAYYVTR